MQRPRLALSVLVAATLCLPLVVGQPPEGTFLTRCNPSVTPTYDGAALSATNLSVCCMWTFPGASGTAGPLVRTGTCSDATTDTIALNNNTINSTQTSDFANCGNVRILDLSDNPIVLTNPNPLPFGFLTSLEVLKLRNVGPEGGKISDLTAITYPTYPSTNFVKLKTLDLSNNAITALPATFPTALSNLQVLKLTNAGAAATKISTLSNVVFPPALKLLDLEGNAITSISSTSFPSSLIHLSLKGNQISSINGVTITLKSCAVSTDLACTLDAPDTALAKSVDLSGNLLTSIEGGTFAGNIVTLKLGQGGDTNKKKLESLPFGATFPNSLTILKFDVANTNGVAMVWSSKKYCNGVAPVTLTASDLEAEITFNPTTCCLWGGKTVASPATFRPLERIGTCTSAQYTATGSTESVLNLTDPYTDSNVINSITSIPALAFQNCGSPDVLLLDNHKNITMLDGVSFPPSLKILSLKNNLVQTLSGLHALTALRVLDLEANKIKSVSGVVFPPSLTHLSLKNNEITSMNGVTITLTSCTDSSACTYPATYSASLFKSVDLSGNLFTSIEGATFLGTIVTLKLGSNGDSNKKKLESLPTGATLATSLTALIFDVDNTKIWSSMKYCNGANDPVPVNLANPIVFDPTSCCLWGGKTVASSATTRPLERIGTCSTAKYTTGTGTESVLNLTDVYTNDQSVYGITSIPAKAFENCGSPDVLLLNNHKSIKTLTGVAFPTSLKILSIKNNLIETLSGLTNLTMLKVLDLEQNKIKSISGGQFPTSLTHLSLKSNHIASIKGVTFTLNSCAVDANCQYPATYSASFAKSVDLSENLLTSIEGATFAGKIEKLDLRGTGTKNPFTKLPIGATFPSSLKKLFFADVTVPRWRSELRCDNTSLESGSNAWPTVDIPFDPAQCCMWGGSNAGTPLERLGKCSSATREIISLRKASPTARFVATPSTRASQGITSIPANSFEDCGSPRVLEITDQPLTSIANVTLPPSLRILDLGDNQIASLASVSFPSLRFLNLGNNKLSSLDMVTVLSSLTHLDLSKNQISSLGEATITLSVCVADDTETAGSSLFIACAPATNKIKTLNLQDNLITSISKEKFVDAIRIRLDNNRISTISGVQFPSTLTTLRLDKNKISTLADITFPTSLTDLNLEDNKISSLAGMTFPGSISILNLKKNLIASLPA